MHSSVYNCFKNCIIVYFVFCTIFLGTIYNFVILFFGLVLPYLPYCLYKFLWSPRAPDKQVIDYMVPKWSITGSPSDRLHSTSDRLKTRQVINYRLHLGLFKQLLNNIMIVYTSQVLGLKKYIQVPCIWGNSMLYLMYISLRNRYLTSLKITSSIPTLCDQLCQ